ncbi:hemopexin repeat-containing protein [Virgisporangium aurantiacum]|uniref:Lysine-specific metallo-endopeptidase domain-containing protein n=1 Tax=Virgisporangium aurantiacum TaxID=175570 RepID=A0A8J3ZH56_9ACTN|nr:hemopexin repeat-containing protein [Virgisporangium aurantiacum]GIJ62827.1 hypothetical protein Vau01_103430 [Virgisporangium aurantiacum]
MTPLLDLVLFPQCDLHLVLTGGHELNLRAARRVSDDADPPPVMDLEHRFSVAAAAARSPPRSIPHQGAVRTKRGTGRDEGSSGPAFDFLIDHPGSAAVTETGTSARKGGTVMRDDFRCSIRMEPAYRRGEPILLWFEIENVSDRDHALLVWDTPLDREVFDFVEVRHRDRIIPYDGRLVKRGDPTPDSYRTIAAGQTIVEVIDLSTSFAFDEHGSYTVTLRPRFRDAVADAGRVVTARARQEHEGFSLDPISTGFDLLPDGEPRLTAGERARHEPPPAGALRLTLGPNGRRDEAVFGFPPPLPPSVEQMFRDTYAAHQNLIVWLDAAIRALTTWSTPAENALYADWFGAGDASRYGIVQSRVTRIRTRLNDEHVYDLSQTDCAPDWWAYTYHGSDTLWLCAGFFNAPPTGMDSRFGTLVHEWSHATARTEDFAYGQVDSRELARNSPELAIGNADNYMYFVEALALRMLTAPMVWPNGKAYLFVSGRYYRYDIATDRVDPGYPLPIAGNWPGVWDDRVDAAVVWPGGKAYLFRGSEYVRYDIAADRVDPGYPLPIFGNWPGLWTDRIDAVLVWPNNKAYFFRGTQYMRYDIAADRVDDGYPLPIAGNWSRLWTDAIHGAVVWPNGRAYFFRGWQYMGYDIAADRIHAVYPLAIAENWPRLWHDGIQAAVFWPNSKAYFFKGSQYMRYDLAADRVDDGYPLPIAGNWPGVWDDRVDAAVVWPGGKAYLFRGSEYVRYDIAADRVDPGYPLLIFGNWPGLWFDRIDAAVVWPNGKVYFFRGSEYMRYDIAADRVDDGYPLPIAGNWPGLRFDRIDAAIVWPNAKAYFFRDDKYVRYDIATDRVDEGYPFPIGPNWPGLPGRVR